MAGINSKNKGNTYERKISKLLSDTFFHITNLKSAFYRNASSGAFFGGKNQFRITTHDKAHQQFGDIICPANFNFSIECKHYKSPPGWNSFINQSVKQWDTWLEQAEQDSTNASKKVMLIVKYNNCDEIVFVKDKYESIVSFGSYKSYTLYKLSDFLTLQKEIFFS